MQHISYEELQEWQAKERAHQLIDVREPQEHAEYNIGGELLPLGQLIQAKDQLNSQQPIVFYCRKGIRSQIAVQRLRRYLPHAELYNLQGGIARLFEENK